MRIIGGEAKGRRLFTPAGLHTRPTADRVREAMFSVLLPRLAAATVLDVFAGSGALGLEALSRGAVSALFMEQDAAALKTLRRNVELCNLPGATVQAGDSLRLLTALRPEFDLIFLDPPYNQGLLGKALDLIIARQLLAPNGLIVAESSSRNNEFSLPSELMLVKHSVYGDTALYYLRPEAGAQNSGGAAEKERPSV